MKHYLPLLFLAILYWQCSQPVATSVEATDYTQYVDPYIGTGFHGHVFLGAHVPFGAVQLGPTNLTEGWDWCSGYHYSDTTLIGFAHTHLSGTGIGDLGDIVLMPTSGEVNLNRGKLSDLSSGYTAFYQHKDEVVKPGFYQVWIDKYQVKAELTATTRAGMHRYTFKDSTQANIILDLERGIGWDLPIETYVRQINSTTLEGYRYSKGWAVDQKIYFVMEFSAPILKMQALQNEYYVEVSELKEERLKAALTFGLPENGEILVKTGISAVSVANARENLNLEIADWDFDSVVKSANENWNRELSKVAVKMPDEDQMKVFYTALYHGMTAPSVFNDINGQYRGANGQTYTDTSATVYTTFSLWDTYRAAHPLFTLTQRDKVEDFVSTFLKIYQQQGKLPIWHLVGNETDCMVGYPAVMVIADAYFKGFDIDGELALEAMKASSTRDDYGVRYLKELNFIPADLEKESVAKAMEYCIADWCIAQVAKSLGKHTDYEYYMNRANAYKLYFDPQTHFMRAKMSTGGFRSPFDAFKSTHIWGDYTEGNAWQYTWLVPQDVEGLIALFGSESSFEEKLDSLFIVEGDLGAEASPDISGLIGQYAHGNEPSHHITYLYNYLGKPWKTAEKVRYIMDELYTSKPDGLCGNEDVGQMSAWYVMSALGFYQVNPANGLLVFGSPLITEAKLKLSDTSTLSIKVENNNQENRYIQSITWNGEVYSKSYISYEMISRGGEMIIKMGNAPASDWGVNPEDRPVSLRW